MNAYQAQRIRFGILAARHTLAREAMTPDQVDYLEGCEAVGWRVGNAGTRKAYEREVFNIRNRARRATSAAWLSDLVAQRRRTHA